MHNRKTGSRNSNLYTDILAKLRTEDCKDLSDSEIERCLGGTVMRGLCIVTAKYMRYNNILTVKMLHGEFVGFSL